MQKLDRYKFRGKRVDGNGWAYGYYLVQVGKPLSGDIIEVHQIFEKNTTHEVEHTTVGQYTDVGDENNAEIYEGDICVDEDGAVYEVLFDEGMFVVRMDGNVLTPLFEVASQIRVAGNKWDNPELLASE